MNPGQKAGVFYWRKIAKGEKDKQLQCGAQTDVQSRGLPNIEVTLHHYCENVRITQLLHFILPL